jgi:uncharacterized membrane protein
MSQASTPRVKPKWTGFMAGWAVFLAFYQGFVALQHGGLFLGENTLVRQDLSNIDLAILYSAMGILFLIIAYAIWTLKWWAFPLGLVVQGMVIAVASIGVIRWLALGEQAPVVWDILDLIFAVLNLTWALSRDVRTAFMSQQSSAS